MSHLPGSPQLPPPGEPKAPRKLSGPQRKTGRSITLGDGARGVGQRTLVQQETLYLNDLGKWIQDRDKLDQHLAIDSAGPESAKKKVKKTKKKKKTIFGVGLEELYAENPSAVPIILLECIKYFKQSGALKQEGIFRVSGQQKHINALADLYVNANVSVDLNEQVKDPNDVASLFKKFFRDLPDSLVPSPMTDTLFELWKAYGDDEDPEEKITKIKEIFSLLPELNAVLLRLLCEFFHKITIYADINMMHSENLGIVIGPSILRSTSLDPITISSQFESKIASFLIKHNSEIFEDMGENVGTLDELKSKKKGIFGSKKEKRSKISQYDKSRRSSHAGALLSEPKLVSASNHGVLKSDSRPGSRLSHAPSSPVPSPETVPHGISPAMSQPILSTGGLTILEAIIPSSQSTSGLPLPSTLPAPLTPASPGLSPVLLPGLPASPLSADSSPAPASSPSVRPPVSPAFLPPGEIPTLPPALPISPEFSAASLPPTLSGSAGLPLPLPPLPSASVPSAPSPSTPSTPASSTPSPHPLKAASPPPKPTTPVSPRNLRSLPQPPRPSSDLITRCHSPSQPPPISPVRKPLPPPPGASVDSIVRHPSPKRTTLPPIPGSGRPISPRAVVRRPPLPTPPS